MLTFSDEEFAQFANSQLNAALYVLALSPEAVKVLKDKARSTFGDGPEVDDALSMYITWASAKGII